MSKKCVCRLLFDIYSRSVCVCVWMWVRVFRVWLHEILVKTVIMMCRRCIHKITVRSVVRVDITIIIRNTDEFVCAYRQIRRVSHTHSLDECHEMRNVRDTRFSDKLLSLNQLTFGIPFEMYQKGQYTVHCSNSTKQILQPVFFTYFYTYTRKKTHTHKHTHQKHVILVLMFYFGLV